MQFLQANWVDIAILGLFGVYIYDGWKRGFLIIAIEVCGFVASIAGALLFYAPVGDVLTNVFNVSLGFAKAGGFVIVWTIIAVVYTPLARYFYRKIPQRFRQSKINRVGGGFVAIVDGALLAAFLLSFVVALPFAASVKKDIVGSKIGGMLVHYTQNLEVAMNGAFGGAVKETLSFMTVRQGSEESVDLKFNTTDFKIDPETEDKMVAMVNAERTQRGFKALKVDKTIIDVSRAHSADMLKRGYFSHITPEGKSPADRADDLHVRYQVYGENIAYAPDVSIAHTGLMNSPGHRANILSPEYGRIGIGIQDAGIYGIMVTQNFAD